METAKVDVRRLQVLNDRINQMFEAFQLMRLSMDALQYMPDERAIFGGVTPFAGYGPFNPAQYLQGGVPYVTTPLGYAPYGQPQYLQGNLPYASYPATPIPQWGASIWARPSGGGYENDATRFIDMRFAPNGRQIPFSQSGHFPFPVNVQPFSVNGQVPSSHSPSAAFG